MILEENCVFSLDLVEKLNKYFNSYYKHLFSKIVPISVQFNPSSSHFRIEEPKKTSVKGVLDEEKRFNVTEKIVELHSLLCVYKNDKNAHRNLLIFPIHCNSKVISNDLINILQLTTENTDFKDDFGEIPRKYGFLNELQNSLDFNNRLFISVFYENNKFTLYELNFNSILNFL
ncbi:uncharacterized protein TA15025 [Theileria annulata]|uniref:Uncharacterized protein n=1 Tax=Theileria annulata TaxID=5874 RepID=Q4UFU4_THEAN|nr:uncharacterized protein TA15025 [Theileria annulata]CAI74214.1 hypothetical protein TA15025 [Theileria annulata]|eukprot:XP_951946.1 hypothetical protein TA15025 [Theileria annulata]